MLLLFKDLDNIPKRIFIIFGIVSLLVAIPYLIISKVFSPAASLSFKDRIYKQADEFEKEHGRRVQRVTQQEAIIIAKKEVESWTQNKYNIVKIDAKVFYDREFQEDKNGPLAWNVDVKIQNKEGNIAGIRHVINALTGEILMSASGIPYGF